MTKQITIKWEEIPVNWPILAPLPLRVAHNSEHLAETHLALPDSRENALQWERAGL